MTSKTFCCNGTLLGKTIKRFWPLWLGYLLVWLLMLPLMLYASLSTFYSDVAYTIRVQDSIYTLLCYGAPILVFLMAPLAATAVFSYLYNTKRAGVFASLPIRREGAFLSLTLAGLIPMLSAHVLTAAVSALVELAYGFIDWASLLTFLGITTLYTLNFYGFAVLCAQLTGHLLIAPTVYAVLSFTAPAIEFLCSGLASMFIYGYQMHTFEISTYLSPLVAIMRFSGVEPVESKETISAWVYHGWQVNAIYGAIGAVLIGLALLLYRKRRMESAGDVVAVKPLKKVFAVMLGGGCGLVLGALLAAIFSATNATGDSFAAVSIGAVLGCWIGYFGAEMLMRKTFRVFGETWRGFAILLAVLALFLCTLRFDLLGWERNLPQAGNVESVVIACNGIDEELSDTENIEAVLRLNKDVVAHRADENEYSTYLRVDYTLRNGAHYLRVYDRVPSYEANADGKRIAEEANAIFNSAEAIAARFPTDVTHTQFHYTSADYSIGDYYQSIEITPEEAYEWYVTCILPDVADGTLGRLDVSNTSFSGVYCYLEIYDDLTPAATGAFAYTRENYTQVLIAPTRESVRTTAWLIEHGLPEAAIQQ